MLKRILLTLPIASLAIAWACQSGSGGATATPTGAGTAGTSHSGVQTSTEVVPATIHFSAGTGVPVQTEFDDNAFPPTLPTDENHTNGWLREDCLMCHESGISNAPLVQHRGMSRLLLSAKCRTCHVVIAPGTAEPGDVPFSRSAFPPTLPADNDHRGGWLRNDCLLCHQNGVQGAPRVIHAGMTSMLLEARCRSCHVPRVDSGQLDLPLK